MHFIVCTVSCSYFYFSFSLPCLVLILFVKMKKGLLLVVLLVLFCNTLLSLIYPFNCHFNILSTIQFQLSLSSLSVNLFQQPLYINLVIQFQLLLLTFFELSLNRRCILLPLICYSCTFHVIQ